MFQGSSHRDEDGHSLTEFMCDSGYLEEAARLCSLEYNSDKCEHDATKFFNEVLTVQHAFLRPHDAPYVCKDTCALDYIQGLTNK